MTWRRKHGVTWQWRADPMMTQRFLGRPVGHPFYVARIYRTTAGTWTLRLACEGVKDVRYNATRWFIQLPNIEASTPARAQELAIERWERWDAARRLTGSPEGICP